MKAVKLVFRADICSFRYPHFMTGRQPSFRVPPPSTIYGLLGAILGGIPGRAEVQVAYTFRFSGVGDDLEHVHVATPGSGRPRKEFPHPVNMEATMTPIRRELLLDCTLALYLNRLDWLDRLGEPRYALSLGRSQDLASLLSTEVVELEQAPEAYAEHGLLPWSYRDFTDGGYGLQMPGWIDPGDRKNVRFQRFLVVERRCNLDGRGTGTFWVDPGAPEWRGRRQAVPWLTSLAEESREALA